MVWHLFGFWPFFKPMTVINWTQLNKINWNFFDKYFGNKKDMKMIPAMSGHVWSDVNVLTHWGRDKMATIFQTTVSNTFPSMKMFKISLKFVLSGPIINISALVQIMAWRRPGDKPLSEPMMVSLLTHICVIRPQRVNSSGVKVIKGSMKIYLNLLAFFQLKRHR